MTTHKILAKAYLWLVLLILYAPVVFIAIFSFTESKVLGNWTGFSTRLYANLFSGNMQGSSSLLSAVENTLLIALIAAAGLSVVKVAFFAGGALTLAALSWKAVALAAVLLVLTQFVPKTKAFHPIVWILLSALAGVIFRF